MNLLVYIDENRVFSLREGVWVELKDIDKYKRYLKSTSPSSQGWVPWSANSCLNCGIDWMDWFRQMVCCIFYRRLNFLNINYF